MFKNRKLRDQLLIGVIPVLIIPLVLMDLLHVGLNYNRQEYNASQRLHDFSANISDVLENHLEINRRAVATMARALQREKEFTPDGINDWLRQTGENNPGFFSLIGIDENGKVIASFRRDPPPGIKSSSPIGDIVSDRTYFTEVQNNKVPYVSNAFMGRRIGSGIIVAVSAPLTKPDGKVMVVEGTLDMNKLYEVADRYSGWVEKSVLVLDPEGQVVYSSLNLNLKQMQKMAGSDFLNAMDKVKLADCVHFSGFGEDQYVCQSLVARYGWRVFVMQPERLVQGETLRYIFFTFGAALVLFVLALAATRAMAKSITRPLEKLNASMNVFLGAGEQTLEAMPPSAPLEVRTLANNFMEMQDKLSKVLSGLLPICSHCKKIRDGKGNWNPVESYIRKNTEAEFTHGICPECMKIHYEEYVEKK